MNCKKLLNLFLLVMFIGLVGASGAMAGQGTPLPGNKIAQFVDPLPLLKDPLLNPDGPIETVIAGSSEITLNMLEFQANMMPSTFKPANGQTYTGTWVFGYRVGPTAAPADAVDTYFGPFIVATRNQPTQVRYVNNLTANNIAWRDWTDMSIHSAFHQAFGQSMPMPFDAVHYMGPVLAVPHLHGAEDPAVIDGGPEAWFASDKPGPEPISVVQGPAYYAGTDVAGGGAHPAALNEAIYRYPNTQEAGPLWFHDHLLGGTRLNATFAGLAGAYAIVDPGFTLPAGLDPVGLGGRLSVPLVLQDRMFDTNGQLYFPNIGINPEHPYWVPEFVGDTIVVNGKVWPYMKVDRQRYRFYVVNGSNSRPYDMFLLDQTTGVKGPRMWVIATDGGYLDSPVLVDPNATGAQKKAGVQKSLFIMPGERYEIIVDFNDPAWIAAITAAYGATVPNPLNIILRNVAATVDDNPKASTEGRIMQFRLSANAPADSSYDPASGVAIRSGAQKIVRLANPVAGTLAAGVTANKTRELTLVEIAGEGGPLEVLVNNSRWSGLRETTDEPIPGSTLVLGNYITEMMNEGETELWEIVNTTMDKHPIHLHGLQFQLVNRQPYDPKAFMAAYNQAFPGEMLIPGYGPPLAYAPSAATGNKYGGNPDITPYLLGVAAPPLQAEAGWKDTVITHPGEVTRFAVRIAPQDKAIGAADLFWTYQPNALNGAYVWHCHITDHEDNEMMRPSQFLPNPSAVRSYVQGTDY
ncbi:multicopper oxidase family protein [Desulforhabdus sp. TSK]|uniref:multicopper oxidase family protein n=1 Tax=Desulforhabdus sp. TSK TaxID=2925014 RepID=UPI001FC86FE4|nr:multicopper oxidase domain-containing protein [Desulforhabdus sp. TSK]GKT09834.1 spore coat protein [Desulforhabdus sp. TSK]